MIRVKAAPAKCSLSTCFSAFGQCLAQRTFSEKFSGISGNPQWDFRVVLLHFSKKSPRSQHAFRQETGSAIFSFRQLPESMDAESGKSRCCTAFFLKESMFFGICRFLIYYGMFSPHCQAVFMKISHHFGGWFFAKERKNCRKNGMSAAFVAETTRQNPKRKSNFVQFACLSSENSV